MDLACSKEGNDRNFCRIKSDWKMWGNERKARKTEIVGRIKRTESQKIIKKEVGKMEKL